MHGRVEDFSEPNQTVNLVVMQVVSMRMARAAFGKICKLKSAKLEEDFLFRMHSNDRKIDSRVLRVTSVVTHHAKKPLVIAYTVLRAAKHANYAVYSLCA